MVLYVLKNHNTNTFIGKSGNKFCEVEKEDDAVKFDSLQLAKINLKNNLSKSLRSCYTPIVCKAEDPQETKNHYKSNFNMDNPGINRVYNDIIFSAKFITESLAEEENLKKKLIELEYQIVDTNHYIEFTKLSASDGYKASKKLQEILFERRKVKDLLQFIEVVKSTKIDVERLCNISERLDSITKRTYLTRNNENLFSYKEKQE